MIFGTVQHFVYVNKYRIGLDTTPPPAPSSIPKVTFVLQCFPNNKFHQYMNPVTESDKVAQNQTCAI